MERQNIGAALPFGRGHHRGSRSSGGMSGRLLVSLVFAGCSLPVASGSEFGEYPCHTSMPPVPTDPAGYENMWDPFVLRAPDTGDPLEVKSESTDGVR